MAISNVDRCLHCGKHFVRGRKWQEYCTRICKDKAFYIRQADKAKKELRDAKTTRS